MRQGPMLWTTYLMLGASLYFQSVGYWQHPAYRLFLMITLLSWAAYIARTPRSH